MTRLVVTRVVSGVLLALGLALLVPLALSLLYRDGSWGSFLLPAVAMATIGGVGLRTTTSLARTPRYVSNREVYLSVTLAWVVAAVLGGVPFLIEGTFDSLADSTFEAMSGFTTTGATLLSDIEAQTPSILFWRSMTQWLGGIGIVVLFAAWVAIFGAASMMVAFQENLTLTSSATAVAATLNVIGPGLGQVGPTESYEIVDPFGRVVLTACMLLGRLELFTALALLLPAFWKR